MTATDHTVEIDLRDHDEVAVVEERRWSPSGAGWAARMAVIAAVAAVALLSPFYLHDRVSELAAAPI